MTAHEQQDERVVTIGVGRAPGAAKARSEIERHVVWRRGDLLLHDRLHDHVGLATSSRRLRSDVIGHASRSDVDEPAARVVRKTFLRPLGRCGQQRLLDRVLRGSEIAEPPDHGADNRRRQIAEQVLCDGAASGRRGLIAMISVE